MVFCTNCRQDIEESKIFLHQRFCFQNIKYCEKCQEGIVIEEYEEHCLQHSLPKEESKSNSKELKRSLTLKRVESSKIGCQYCGFFCSYGELEEHEKMCGSRSSNCKQCGKFLLIKDLKSHLEKEHKIKIDDYQQMQSGNFNSSSGLFGNPNTDLNLKRMTTDEEIAYALALSAEEEKERKNKNNSKTNFNSKDRKLNLSKKISDKIDYDELDYEYEKHMYEDEMNGYNKDENN